MRNGLSVDLEDWYHGLTSTNRQPQRWSGLESRVLENTEHLLALFDEFDVKATFFVLGKVAERYPDLIQNIDAAGHEIGVHGHEHRMVDRMEPVQFEAELDYVLGLLGPLVEGEIIGFRAPYFSINRKSLYALDILAAKGFRYDSSFFPTRNMLYGYPEAPRYPHTVAGDSGLVEFPLSTVRALGVTWPVAGGLYVRTLPYAAVRWSIRGLNRDGWPGIMYMHPWELDLSQPMRAATLRERITHYHGRSGLERKIRRLLGEFEFGPLRDLLDNGWKAKGAVGHG